MEHGIYFLPSAKISFAAASVTTSSCGADTNLVTFVLNGYLHSYGLSRHSTMIIVLQRHCFSLDIYHVLCTDDQGDQQEYALAVQALVSVLRHSSRC